MAACLEIKSTRPGASKKINLIVSLKRRRGEFRELPMDAKKKRSKIMVVIL